MPMKMREGGEAEVQQNYCIHVCERKKNMFGEGEHSMREQHFSPANVSVKEKREREKRA